MSETPIEVSQLATPALVSILLPHESTLVVLLLVVQEFGILLPELLDRWDLGFVSP